MIYIRFISEKWSLISAAIRFETRCWASHVELVRINSTEDVVDVMACRWPHGLKHYPYITKNVTREEWYEAPGLPFVWEWMESNPMKYDLSAIFGIATDSDFHDDDRDICSESLVRGNEYAAEKNESPRWLETRNIQPWRITPRDLLLSPYLRFYRRVR